MKKQILTILGCGLIATASMATSVQEIEQSNKCSSVVFRLPANPTTGYSWKVLDYNQSRFKIGKTSYDAKKTNRIGSGGESIFTFSKVDKNDIAKEAVFLLAYGQEWNKQSYENTVVIVKFVDTPCKS